jgi:hypothetical protein
LAQEITAYIAVTDRDWFDTLSARGTLDEVNLAIERRPDFER